ncbi:MAG TPA: asparaginase [Candidatus Limnocylindrales bacterium]|nr:asparaginase [Candidatus Limnocylindrales bacterium]
MRSETLVEIVRGDAVEVRHRGSIVVVDCQGNDVHVAGDADRPVFLRSAIKPFVAALVVQSGAADALRMEPVEVAMVAASHGGTDEDVAAVQRLLDRIGKAEHDLHNGTGGPSDEATKTRLAAAGEEPGPLRQMCSGEHAGILALSIHSGWPADGYWEAGHPAQRAIEQLVTRLVGGDGPPPRAGDDCALPTWQVPLASIARAYAWLARPERLPAELADLEPAFRRVRDAMRSNPVRISGPGQFDTDLTGADGAFVAKEGAEGLIGIGSVGAGLGVSVTIDDGDKTRRATSVVAIEALSRLGLLEPESERKLRDTHWPRFVDPEGRTVAEARPAFHLPSAE